uniref:AAA+ ATPase domain-containing protein n=1 Tax=Quercus lobata TaxID=97700 RepID=A0A7N2M2L4_QUELO
MELELIKPVIEKIEANLLKQIGQQIGYLIHLNSNIRNLKDQFQKLDEKRRGVQLGIDEAKRNVELIAPEIESWVCKVDNIIPGLQRFLEEDVKANTMCLDGWCPNPKSRYSLSRNAKKKTLEIDGLLRDATAFVTKASYSRPPLGIGSLSIEGIMDFESRTKIRKEVLEALRADKDNIIAICGMGGIGKTTMAKEVAKRAKDDKLFDEVVMAVVSQNQDLRKIQGQIAEMLGLKLVEENSLVRKERLIKRLMDDKSILVILDDVWDVLDLEAVGIPYGGQQKRCKLLLTSRSEEACIQMKAKIFPIKVLTEEEAWSLLRDKAGNCTDTPNLCPIAKEVAKECGGLPVTIITVGRALEDKSKVEWDAALQQLKKSILKNIPGLDSKVYSSMELSYNYLGSNEAKSCLLLCCLFPEDHDIPIEYLVRYGVGQRLFKRIDNVAEARNIVHAIVKNLKRSSLLLDSEKVECVKMHDVVRDFAISKADELGFLLSCSKLTTQMFPTNLFKGMKELKVLSMQGMSFLSLPQSIRVLENLRTLHLDYCKFEDVSAIGALKKLEMLSFFGSRIRELPRETKNLSHLKLLDLSKCFDLQRIPPGLLSSLSRLEELYMGEVLMEWEPTEGNREGEGSNASLVELMSFSHHLMALEICIPNPKSFPKDFLFKNHMTRFHISTGNLISGGFYRPPFIDQFKFQSHDYLFENSLVLWGVDMREIPESPMLHQLLQKSEILELREVKNFKNILYELDQKGFQCLKVLRVRHSKDVEYVIDTTSDQTPQSAFPILESLELSYLVELKEICHGLSKCSSLKNVRSDSQLAFFVNLKSLWLSKCSRLKNVFSLSIARGLVKLQELEIERCDYMEEIFLKEGEEDEMAFDRIKFPQLTSIRISCLPKLIGFCTAGDPAFNISHKLFSSKTILWLLNLENLKLNEANSLRVIFDLGGLKVDHDYQRMAVLAQLKTLGLRSLSKLTEVWNNVPRGVQGFQNLKSIIVNRCHRLSYLFPSSVAKLLVELQSITVDKCDAIENTVQRDGEEDEADISVFHKVTSIDLIGLPSLVSLSAGAYSFAWLSMKKIDMKSCPKLKTFGSEIWSPRKQKKTNRDRSTTKKSQGSTSVNKERIGKKKGKKWKELGGANQTTAWL